jgi:hypothetical protein
MTRRRRISQRTEKLKREGWVRQFLATEPRLSEAVKLYQTIGYDVHLEPLTREEALNSAGDNSCTVCFDAEEDRYKVIYIRSKKERVESEDDLW